MATLFLTPLLAHLPQATLAATIIVAVLSLVDFGAIRRVWVYSKIDFSAMAATILGTLFLGVEIGVVLGRRPVAAPPPLPHLAAAYGGGGQRSRDGAFPQRRAPPGDHRPRRSFRSAIDESLYFANSRLSRGPHRRARAERPDLAHVILMCSAVNAIDASALESLEEINHRLHDAGITLHLSEVKGPVMDGLARTHFLNELTGNVYLTQFDAFSDLSPRLAQATLAEPRRDTSRAVA